MNYLNDLLRNEYHMLDFRAYCLIKNQSLTVRYQMSPKCEMTSPKRFNDRKSVMSGVDNIKYDTPQSTYFWIRFTQSEGVPIIALESRYRLLSSIEPIAFLTSLGFFPRQMK